MVFLFLLRLCVLNRAVDLDFSQIRIELTVVKLQLCVGFEIEPADGICAINFN